jgi:hypothetical protein
MDPLWSVTCWSTFKYFIILIVSANYILCISWVIKCLIVIDARCKHEDSPLTRYSSGVYTRTTCWNYRIPTACVCVACGSLGKERLFPLSILATTIHRRRIVFNVKEALNLYASHAEARFRPCTSACDACEVGLGEILFFFQIISVSTFRYHSTYSPYSSFS